jgi:2-oxoglutarate dehydrogenase E2 component (dihydrolipoamide succinyltransferase)
MPTNVIMPQLGESVVEGTVSKWLKKEGDPVKEFEPLLEISTDKVDTEIPAPATGVLLKILVQEGQTVERGVLLAVIGEEGESPSDKDAPMGVVQEAHAPQRQAGRSNGETQTYAGHVTPVVARMVAEHHLDLSQIKGTGRDGRVTKKDVEAYLATRKGAPAAQPAVDLPPWEQPGTGDLFKPSVNYGEESAPAPKQPTPAKESPQVAAPIPTGVPGELVKISNMRRAIAQHMVESKLHISPHVTSVFEVDMTAVLVHREAHKDEYAKQNVNLTLTAYFTAATVTALQATPYLNAQWADEGIYLHRTCNVGIAVAIEDGLIVPVVKNAQDYNLLGLARVINDLTNRARNKQLKPDEVQGGTFTITNHGVGGSLFAMPIINQPQAGILGVGVLEKRVKVINDAIAIRPCVYVSLTFDHRIADGATGDHFLATLKKRLEEWN